MARVVDNLLAYENEKMKKWRLKMKAKNIKGDVEVTIIMSKGSVNLNSLYSPKPLVEGFYNGSSIGKVELSMVTGMPTVHLFSDQCALIFKKECRGHLKLDAPWKSEYEAIVDQMNFEEKTGIEKYINEMKEKNWTVTVRGHFAMGNFHCGICEFPWRVSKYLDNDICIAEREETISLSCQDFESDYIGKYSFLELLDAIDSAKNKIAEIRKASQIKNDKKIQEAILEAKRTGIPVIIKQYSVDCDDLSEECNVDNIVTTIDEFGKIETTRHHTW